MTDLDLDVTADRIALSTKDVDIVFDLPDDDVVLDTLIFALQAAKNLRAKNWPTA